MTIEGAIAVILAATVSVALVALKLLQTKLEIRIDAATERARRREANRKADESDGTPVRVVRETTDITAIVEEEKRARKRGNTREPAPGKHHDKV